MVNYNKQTIEELKSGDFTNLAEVLNDNNFFEDFNVNMISHLVTGCGINKNTKVLYLTFLEVSKFIKSSIESHSLLNSKEDHDRMKGQEISSKMEYKSKELEFFYEKWFQYHMKNSECCKLMHKIFDVAYRIYEENNDFYASEIVEYMCTSEYIEDRKYALLKMKNVERFLDDENEELANIAKEISAIQKAYEELPLDGKLLVDLLETAYQINFIKLIFKPSANSHEVQGQLFKNDCFIKFPDYYFKMANYKMIAYRIYEAIVQKELEFAEKKTPIFYHNLLSNNTRVL